MTNDGLALSYLRKARVRLKMLQVLMDNGAWSDVVREAQEIVELALKAALRHECIEPPKWHDVGDLLVENAARFPESMRSTIPRLAAISKWLRSERELSFYGNDDFIPTEEYSREDGLRAMDDAGICVEFAGRLIEDPGA